jgi:hypothetical protein
MLTRFLVVALLVCAGPALSQELEAGWSKDATTGCRVWNAHPWPNESVSWSGPCSYGLANGRGVLRWFLNDTLLERDDGEFIDGKANGEFVTTLADGSRYEGQRRNSERDGRGTITFAGGNRYEGEWRRDKFDGQGKYTWKSGTRYEGEWREGKPNGWGKATYAWDGSVYEGIWNNGCFKQGSRRWALFAAPEECASSISAGGGSQAEIHVSPDRRMIRILFDPDDLAKKSRSGIPVEELERPTILHTQQP